VVFPHGNNINDVEYTWSKQSKAYKPIPWAFNVDFTPKPGLHGLSFDVEIVDIGQLL
jgi:hypothetical protein